MQGVEKYVAPAVERANVRKGIIHSKAWQLDPLGAGALRLFAGPEIPSRHSSGTKHKTL